MTSLLLFTFVFAAASKGALPMSAHLVVVFRVLNVSFSIQMVNIFVRRDDETETEVYLESCSTFLISLSLISFLLDFKP